MLKNRLGFILGHCSQTHLVALFSIPFIGTLAPIQHRRSRGFNDTF
jgi:hypothetical protein